MVSGLWHSNSRKAEQRTYRHLNPGAPPLLDEGKPGMVSGLWHSNSRKAEQRTYRHLNPGAPPLLDGCTPLVAGSRRSWFRMPSGMPLCCSGSPSKQPPRSPSGPHPHPLATDPVSTAGALHSANFDAKGGSGWVATDPVHCRGAPPLGAGHLPPRSPTTARKTPGADCRPLSLDAPPAAASGPSPLPAAPTQRRGYCRSHQCGALPPGTYASSGHAQPRGLPAAPWHSARGGRSTRRHTEGRTKRTLLQADTRRSGACDGNTRRGRASSSRVVRGQRRGAMRRPFRGPEWRGQQADVRGPNEDQ